MHESEARYLSPDEVARFCGVSIQTVTSWLQKGKLPSNQESGEHLVRARDLVHFMHQNHLAIPAELLSEHTHASTNPVPKALVVDEDKPMANAIERVLRNMGLEVLQVNNGFDASVTYIRRKPHLMTLDLNLEGIGGVELIEHIRNTQTHKAKILVISNSMPSLMSKAKAAGADAVITKPFDNDSLRRAVRILLDLG
ncbi:response regulator [Saccharophagus sp. K07]|uniref:response regulator n=1 Tax=Saccharophagus sp. K07 TaxID=2283636 RepID=UPI0016525E22|nr:response regulator [Saccharophagus sp. K07]MBC6906476.1 response regulator [Saccharophagus sp. K07]